MFPDLQASHDSSITLQLEMTEPLPLPESFAQKYPGFAQVQPPQHRSGLAWLCELLGILDEDPAPRFATTHYSSGGWHEVWEIRTRNLCLARNIEQELSESGGHVQDITNTITLGRLPRNVFLDWRGELGHRLPITLVGVSAATAERVEQVATRLFNRVTVSTRAFRPRDWLRSALYLERVFKNPLPGPVPAEWRHTLAELLADPESDVALAALEHLNLNRIKDDLDPEIVSAFMTAVDQARAWVVDRVLSRIGIYQPPRLLEVILHALRHRSEEVRVAALSALSYYKDRHDLIPHLADHLRSPRLKLQRGALCALHELAGPAHRPEYLEFYQAALHRGNDELRGLAIRFLSDMREPATFEILIKALADPKEEYRRVACAGLVALGNPAAIPALLRLFDDRGQYLPGEARQAVAKLRELEARGKPPA